MTTTVNHESHSIDASRLFNDLTLLEMSTTVGGSEVTLNNIQGGVNNKSDKSSLNSMDGNKIFTIDLSGLTMNFIFLIDIF
ncbi:hypothetical protein I8752_13515 [Nostocaceae cyanobacterium CENA369]|uniref:Uncharacterized protein n=1 Tax=Dendronalium phyllosphericum CENA369 TaxID=1725256 RepID=A0A8J7I4T9_9NOST|nr:hypothetical protein [Dendronalium phyllosphericum]MBH8574023.1 hypothetical protein [Dendronalium phyllosphericum CENA369]